MLLRSGTASTPTRPAYDRTVKVFADGQTRQASTQLNAPIGVRSAAANDTTATSTTPWARVLLWAGIAGPALFALVFVVDGFIHPSYNAVTDFVSELSRGELGWLQIVNFLIFGIALILFAVGIRWGAQRGAGSAIGAAAFALLGASFIVAAVFVTDPHTGGVHTAAGTIHNADSLVVLVGIPLACFVFAGRYAGRMRSYSIATGVFVAILSVATLVAMSLNISGALQRVTIVASLVWITILGLLIKGERAGAPLDWPSRSAGTKRQRGKYSWIVFAVLNPIVGLVGISFVISPSSATDIHGFTGLLSIPVQLWGAFLVASAVGMLIVGVTGFRLGRRWAWYAAWYEVIFLAVNVAFGPGGIIPTLFAIVVIATLGWSYRRFVPAAVSPNFK